MLKHWIWLTQRKGIGHVGCRRLLELFGTAEQIYALDQQQCLLTKGITQRWIATLLDKDLTDAERVVSDCDRLGIQIITYADDAYPERLKQIYDPPAVLYCKGIMPAIDQEATVGIVGTRKCSNFGILHTKQLSSLIALSGGIVISGGARGIDTVALSSALGSIMPVICVLAGGLDDYYPRENKPLFDAICKHGCLLSEFPPGEPTKKMYFIARNRLISGLSLATLVVEAPKGSGALRTAEFALSQNRDVYTVRRAEVNAYCTGNFELIDSGCETVNDGWELLSAYASMFPDRLIDGRTREAAKRLYMSRYGASCTVYSPVIETIPRFPSAPPAPRPIKIEKEAPEPIFSTPSAMDDGDGLMELADFERKVLAVFGDEPLETDVVIARCGFEPSSVITALTMLQLKKRIIKCFGNSYQRI
ncbi:MAG: DNA-processing protein DprA [Oscillospiraceae bacterium]|nr:DNA-processing protein DprA [Oscillospiraceae bacterium]